MKMNRYHTAAMVLVLSALVLVAMFGCLDRAQDVPIAAQSIGERPLVPFEAFVSVSDLEASKWYILVDISDNTNYPHARTNSINLKQLSHTGVLSNTTHWDVKFGVAGTVLTTGVYIEWIHIGHRVRNTQYHWDWALPEHGLNLAVKSDGTLWNVASAAVTTTALITSSTVLSTAGTYSNTVGVGDLVLFVEEVESGGYFDHLSAGALYGTE